MTTTRNRKIVIVVLIIFIAIMLSVFLLRDKSTTIAAKQTYNLPSNTLTSDMYVGDGHSIFSNGREFVRYDFSNNQASSLSNTKKLPRIQSIIPSPDGKQIAFQTPARDTDDHDLSSVIGPESTEIPSWWLLDTSTKQISYVFQSTEPIQWEGEQLHFLNYSDIASYNHNSKEFKLLTSSEDEIRTFKVYKNSIYYLTSANKLNKFDRKSKRTSEELDNVGKVIFSKDEGCYAVFSGENEADDTKTILHGCTDKEITLKEKNIYSLIFTEVGDGIVYSDGITVHYRNFENGQFGNISAVNESENNIELLVAYDFTRLFFRSEVEYYITGTESKFQPINELESLNSNGMAVDFIPNDQIVRATKDGEVTDDDMSTVEQIVDRNIGPNKLYVIEIEMLPDDSIRF